MPILSGQATLAGVVGWPVGHSRSPRIHGYWLDRYGIDGAYLPLPVRPAEFIRALAGLRACGFAGVNVTLPHKLAAFAACDSVDELGARVGAVNTLVFRDGRVTGTNTDCFGFVEGLQNAGIDPAAGPALVLGAGGAARAVVAALLDAGAEVSVANRTEARAAALRNDFPTIGQVVWERRAAALADVALVVNTTSLGMAGQPPLDLDLSRAGRHLAVADIVYTPLETGLLRGARAAGLRTADGLSMLLHQARPGFAAWFGVEPTVDAELRAFVAADLVGA